MISHVARWGCLVVGIAAALLWTDARFQVTSRPLICRDSARPSTADVVQQSVLGAPVMSLASSVQPIPIPRDAPNEEATTKPIEAIAPGDVVLAVDEATGKRVPRRVVRTFKRVTDHLRLLTVRGSEGPEQRIETTDEHPFWIEDRGWVGAGELRPGDKLTEAGGQPAALVATEYIAHPEGVTVYNFEVEELHSYFVAAQGARAPPLLAHNACNIVTVEQVLEQTAKNLDRGASSAHRGLLAANRPITILGQNPVFDDVVNALGSGVRAMKVPEDVFKAMSRAQKWATNKNFLVNSIKKGSEIILVSDPMKAERLFKREVDFLIGRGFEFIKEGEVWRAIR